MGGRMRGRMAEDRREEKEDGREEGREDGRVEGRDRDISNPLIGFCSKRIIMHDKLNGSVLTMMRKSKQTS